MLSGRLFYRASVALLIVPFIGACGVLKPTGKKGDSAPTPTPDGGGGGGGGGTRPEDENKPLPVTPGAILKRPSKSSSIAISADDALVAMVNPEDDSVSFFRTSDNTRIARVAVGDEPSSIVLHPDGDTAYVANRADATISKVTGIKVGNPVASPAKIAVGSEPTGIALSPTGASLFVAEWAEGRIAVIDTATLAIRTTLPSPSNPRALVVTNNLDTNDADELLIVTEFYGEPTAEVKDDGRIGIVRVIQLSDFAESVIRLAPLDSGFVPDGTQGASVKTSPNQLASVTTQNGRLYVTSVSASPEGPVKFNTNVQPVVYVAEIARRAELPAANAGTVNLAKKVAEAIPAGSTRHFLADLIDIDFKGDSNIAYVLSRGADVVQRVIFDAANNTVSIGSSFNVQIDLPGCQTPIGIVTSFSTPRAYVNCWVSGNLGVIDLANQSLAAKIESTPPPSGLAAQINKGRRFFFTARGRWSKDSWSDCASCHPDGLSDNITWAFPAGPRQSTSMDGTFSHSGGVQKQRILNWSAIFEEIHDFERNTRGVSGGLGAVTISPTNECGKLDKEQRKDVPATTNLDLPVKELQDEADACTKDWDDIEAWVKTIRPPRALQTLDPVAVQRGAALFGPPGAVNAGGCVNCHGGAGWTISRRFFKPTKQNNTDLITLELINRGFLATTLNYHSVQIAPQPVIAADQTGGAEAEAIAPKQVACVLRNVATFGLPGDVTATDAIEKKDGGARAQGRGGYNVPSLYGISVGAPYLHHGQAKTLEAVFESPRWELHLRSGNAVFLTGTREQNAQQIADLVSFLRSIDQRAAEQQLPPQVDICPSGVF